MQDCNEKIPELNLSSKIKILTLNISVTLLGVDFVPW